MRLTSRVVHPPASGVPAGRIVSLRCGQIDNDTYLLVPTRGLQSSVGGMRLKRRFHSAGISPMTSISRLLIMKLSKTAIESSCYQAHLRYTGELPIRSRMRLMMAFTPWSSMSSVEMSWKPTASSFSMSPIP